MGNVLIAVDGVSAVPDDERRAQPEGRADQQQVRHFLPVHLHVGLDGVADGRLEILIFVMFPAERLHQADCRHRTLNGRGELRVVRLGLGRPLLENLRVVVGDPQQNRRHRQRHQRQPPIHGKHQPGHNHQRHRVDQHRLDHGVVDVLRAKGVVAQAVNRIALRLRLVIRQRQRLQLAEQIAPHAHRPVVTDADVQKRLEHAEQFADEPQRQHHAGQRDDLPRLALREQGHHRPGNPVHRPHTAENVVEQHRHRVRLEQPRERRQRHQPQGDKDQLQVRAEVRNCTPVKSHE